MPERALRKQDQSNRMLAWGSTQKDSTASNLIRHHVVRCQLRAHRRKADDKTHAMMLMGFHRDVIYGGGFGLMSFILWPGFAWFEQNSFESKRFSNLVRKKYVLFLAEIRLIFKRIIQNLPGTC
jgi:hypothetical protein